MTRHMTKRLDALERKLGVVLSVTDANFCEKYAEAINAGKTPRISIFGKLIDDMQPEELELLLEALTEGDSSHE